MSRRCSICTHPSRADIDAKIVLGETIRTIADEFNVSESALKRHKKHISEIVVDTERQKAVSDTARMLTELSRGFESLAKAADQAEAAGDYRVMAQLWKTASDLAKPLLSISGDLPGDGTTINIYQSTEWVKIRTVILKVLEPHPEIRLQLATALTEVEN